MGIRVTDHAIQRYRERVTDVPDEQIVAALSGKAFAACSAIGRGAVVLPTGHRVIVDNGIVVTVLPKGAYAAMRPRDV